MRRPVVCPAGGRRVASRTGPAAQRLTVKFAVSVRDGVDAVIVTLRFFLVVAVSPRTWRCRRRRRWSR
jgi:hypothetical protein